MNSAGGRMGRNVRWGLVGALLVVAGCYAGPNFVRPPAPAVQTYTDSLSNLTSSDTLRQSIAVGQVVSAHWWELFRSSPLNDLVGHAVAGNQTLAAAQATLAEAQEGLAQARGAYLPQVDVTASAERQRVSGSASLLNSAGAIRNLYSVGPTVSYAVDAVGGIHRRVEQQAALADNARYQLAATYLALTGNAVARAIDIASLRLQLRAVDDLLVDDQKILDLAQVKFDAGKAAQSEVLTAKSQLATDRTLVPPLREQLDAARHALSVLAGKFPAEWSPPDFDLEHLTLPGNLPVTLPSELVRQRPDILAAESELHAASAAIGVAQAQLYPSLTLSGSLSADGSSGNPSNIIWSLFSGITAPLFHGGALRAQKRAAVDAYQASFAVYRETVLSAFQQVADVLHALDNDTPLVETQGQALSTSQASLGLQRLSYTAGKSSLLELVDAERTYQQASLGYAKALAQRYQDTVQLFIALGGGWWQTSGL